MYGQITEAIGITTKFIVIPAKNFGVNDGNINFAARHQAQNLFSQPGNLRKISFDKSGAR